MSLTQLLSWQMWPWNDNYHEINDNIDVLRMKLQAHLATYCRI